MLTRNSLPVFIAICAVIWLGTNTALTQNSANDFHQALRNEAAFDETGFAALQQGQTVVKVLPVEDKREVAVCGLVGLQVPSEVFLQSFIEGMSRKSNPAILEIGRVSSTPSLEDFRSLTFEERDLDDLKECVVGDCSVKLSAAMIERFRKEVDFQAPDYRLQATQMLKQMLLEYVTDYLTRGDAALIEYNDKYREVRVAEEQRALLKASTSYVSDMLPKASQSAKDTSTSGLRLVENAIVWSKIRFGLKPVLAINHITVYKREAASGPQVVIASKQIYANHYFNSSVALTAFVSVPGANPGAYLFYENRSLADGLEGMFGKLKRGVVEDKAQEGLRAILEGSKTNLHARASEPTQASAPAAGTQIWRRWKSSRVYVFLSILLLAGFLAWFALGHDPLVKSARQLFGVR